MATGLIGSITPQTATDTVKVTVSGGLLDGNPSTTNVFATLFRGSTDIGPAGGNGFCRGGGGVTTSVGTPCAWTFIDTPGSSSSVTYTVKIKTSNGAVSVLWNETNGYSVMLMEDIKGQ